MERGGSEGLTTPSPTTSPEPDQSSVLDRPSNICSPLALTVSSLINQAAARAVPSLQFLSRRLEQDFLLIGFLSQWELCVEGPHTCKYCSLGCFAPAGYYPSQAWLESKARWLWGRMEPLIGKPRYKVRFGVQGS